MEKENIEIDDVREVVKLLKEYRPKVTYFTQYEYHKGYSQTNETSLELREVDYDVDEDSFYEGSELGEYESGKTLYHDNVYECEINVLKLDSFIDLLNHYIEIKGDNCDDWSFDNFFEWFHPFDGDFPDTELRYKIFDKKNYYETLGYTELKNNDITWCVGFNNFNYHGIKIDDIETENKVFSFSGCWDDYNGE